MKFVIFPILLVVGAIIGFAVSYVLNNMKVSNAKKEADKILNQAKKDVEKIKRDAALEQKEEAHKQKMDLEKEIREKKAELKESENTFVLILCISSS